VSTTDVEATVTVEPVTPAPTPFLCSRCQTPLQPDQEWCLNCGTAARTAIAATPNWKRPIVLLAVAAAVFAIACAWAFVELTNNDDAVKAATQTQQQTPAPTAEPAPGG
jgi:RNA polymerase subunit RPABC4/transcription elongation factor Spt4